MNEITDMFEDGPELARARQNEVNRDDSDRPLSPNERAALRELLQADKRRVWVVSVIKQISLWIIAVSAAFAIFHDSVKEFFKLH